jgi:cyanophycin synthetase
MVEAHLKGNDHRLMVIDGRFVAAIRREPSLVVGDGQKPVATLVAELNAQRSSNMVRSRYLRPIALDDVLARHLSTQRLALTDVPVTGQRVSLRSNANLSTGGMCTDVTARCHPQIRSMAELLAKTSGISTIGIDYLTTDITQAPAETGGAFIEMNTTPGLDACVAAGWSEAAIARLVLGDCVQRIPVQLTVIGAAGLDAIRTSMAKPELAEDEALVVGDGLRVGGVSLRIVAIEPWGAVKASLRNVGVGKLHVICSAGDLIRHGCPLDRVSQVTVAEGEGGAALDANWVGVLKSLSEDAVAYEPEQEILHRLGAGLTRGDDREHWPSETTKLLVKAERR